MDKEEFKKMCPNLYKGIQDNMKQYEIYGIKFRSHSGLTWFTIRDRVENITIDEYRFNCVVKPMIVIPN